MTLKFRRERLGRLRIVERDPLDNTNESRRALDV
jgi:hypothetical protein